MKTDETHIPTQQAPPKKDDRIPRPYEDCGRPQGDQSPPPSGPQKARRLIFSKAMRLKSRREFQKVMREGKRQVGRFLCVDARPAKESKLGISASSRYGSAPERNRFKRLVREAFRKTHTSFPSLELNVVPRQCAKKATAVEIQDEFTRLLS